MEALRARSVSRDIIQTTPTVPPLVQFVREVLTRRARPRLPALSALRESTALPGQLPVTIAFRDTSLRPALVLARLAPGASTLERRRARAKCVIQEPTTMWRQVQLALSASLELPLEILLPRAAQRVLRERNLT